MPHTKPLAQQRSRKLLFALLYASAGVFLIGAVFSVTTILTLVDEIRENQKVNASTNRAVLDCTQPEGKCAKEGARRTGEAVSNIGQLSVYASACAADIDGEMPVRQRAKLIEQCVTELLESRPGVG